MEDGRVLSSEVSGVPPSNFISTRIDYQQSCELWQYAANSVSNQPGRDAHVVRRIFEDRSTVPLGKWSRHNLEKISVINTTSIFNEMTITTLVLSLNYILRSALLVRMKMVRRKKYVENALLNDCQWRRWVELNQSIRLHHQIYIYLQKRLVMQIRRSSLLIFPESVALARVAVSSRLPHKWATLPSYEVAEPHPLSVEPRVEEEQREKELSGGMGWDWNADGNGAPESSCFERREGGSSMCRTTCSTATLNPR